MKGFLTQVALCLLVIGFGVLRIEAQGFLTNGLLAYYPFNGTANDASGNGFDGTVHGATPVPDYLSRPNSAYYLNGTNAYIYYGPILPDMLAITVAGWVKSYGGGTFFADADWQINNDFTLGLGASYTTVRDDKPPAPVGFSTTIPLSASIEGYWRHIAWVVTTNLIQVYVDGVPLPANGNLGGVDVGYHDFVIGTLEFPQGSLGWGGYWTGAVSKLRIYKRALAASEVQQLYAYDSAPRLGLLKLNNLAFLPVLSNLNLSTNYQLQLSSDLLVWTNQGAAFAATNNDMEFPQYFDASAASRLFFRLRSVP